MINTSQDTKLDIFHPTKSNSQISYLTLNIYQSELPKVIGPIPPVINIDITVIEQWKSIVDYENLYLISTLGRVFSYYRRIYLTPQECNGYLRVTLSKDKKVNVFFLHRLVAFAFIRNNDPENATVVNHKDRNRQNNCIENLEWVSPAENSRHAQICPKKNGSERPVIQYNINGTYINRFASATEAVRSLNIATLHITHISKVCQGKAKIAGGFYWKYETELEIPVSFDNSKEIPGFPNYMAFPDGKIYSKYLNRYLITQENKNGYSFVFLRNNGFQSMMLVHRIIAQTFLPNPEKKNKK